MSSTSSELFSSSSWSSAAERIGLLQGQRAILQGLARSPLVSAAAAVADERAARGGIRAGAGAVPRSRHADASSGSAAAARRGPTGSGTGGAGSISPGDADDDAPSPSPGLTAEMALSILVDCFGH